MYRDLVADLNWACCEVDQKRRLRSYRSYLQHGSAKPTVSLTGTLAASAVEGLETLGHFAVHRVRRQLGYPSRAFKMEMRIARRDNIVAMADRIRAERAAASAETALRVAERTSTSTATDGGKIVEPLKSQKDVRPSRARKTRSAPVETPMPSITTTMMAPFVLRDPRYADAHYGTRLSLERVDEGSMAKAWARLALYGVEQIGLIVQGPSAPVVVPLAHDEAHILAGDLASRADEVEYGLRVYGRRIIR